LGADGRRVQRALTDRAFERARSRRARLCARQRSRRSGALDLPARRERPRKATGGEISRDKPRVSVEDRGVSDEQRPDQRSRAQLEAIVFGRGGSLDDPEYESARAELARLLDADRPDPVIVPSAERLAPPFTAPSPAASRTVTATLEPATRRPPTRRRVSMIALGAIGAVAVLIGGAQLKALTTTDSMTIFDRPQTDRDLALPLEQNGLSEVAGSIRYVGSSAGLDAFVYSSSTVDPDYACLIAVEADRIVGSSCVPPEEFSAGITARVVDGMAWTLVSWAIRAGVTSEDGSYPAAPTAMDRFDDPQDDDDLAALTFVPGIRADLQRTARYLGSNSGYGLLAYRGDGDDVCLAIYTPSTVVLNAESTCVSEDDFDRHGISVLYPGSSPRVQISWGPDAVTTVSLG
jgi:hypothetical protein